MTIQFLFKLKSIVEYAGGSIEKKDLIPYLETYRGIKTKREIECSI